MQKLYPQNSNEYKRQIKDGTYNNLDEKYIMCYKNIFDKDICKNKKATTLAKTQFFIPILDMEPEQVYSEAIDILKNTHFSRPLVSIKNVVSVKESILEQSPHLSQIFVGGLIIDNRGRVLLIREQGQYSVPNYRLEFSKDVYTKPVGQLLAETAFENLDRDLDIYPIEEGDNQAFDIASGIIINSNNGNFYYVNKTLFLTIYRVDDFDRLTIEHKDANKMAVILTLEEASSLVNHPEVSSPWLDYIIASLLY